MSVHNLISYLLGWNELKWIEKDAKSDPIDFPSRVFGILEANNPDFKGIEFDTFYRNRFFFRLNFV